MFERVVRATFSGLLAWPDLMVFGFIGFGVAFAVQAVFDPFWADYARRAAEGGAVPALMAVIVLLAQQALLTVGSTFVAVGAARVALARLRGAQASIADGFRLAPFASAIVSYSFVFAVVSAGLNFVYLLVLFGGTGFSLAGDMATSGLGSAMQVPTAGATGSALLAVLLILPAIFVWAVVNLLAPPVIAAERRGSWQVIARGRLLIKHSWTVLVGMVVSLLGFGCVAALVLSYFVATDAGLTTGAVPAALPELPLPLTAILTALLFVVGTIYTSAWYIAAAEVVPPEAEV